MRNFLKRKSKQTICFVLSIITLLLMVPTVVKADTNIIRVGTSGTYYPFTYIDGKDQKGFEIDVWNEIGKRLGYKVEFVNASFSGLFGMLDSGKVDVLANQITITDERKEKYYFSTPYVESGTQIVVSDKNPGNIKSFEDLKGKKIGVDLGSNFEQVLKERKSGANIITYQSTDAAFNDLMLGRIDGVVTDRISAIINISEKGLPLVLVDEPFEVIRNAYVFQKTEDNKKLIKQVNQILAQLTEDGTLEEISMKWLEVDVTVKSDTSFASELREMLLSGLGVTLLLSLIAMVIGLFLGIIIAIIRFQRVAFLFQLLTGYVSFFRGTPVLVQLFLLYFGLPQIIPSLKGMSGFTATFIALGLNASAYIAEVLRGSFNTIDRGQMEACITIGMNPSQAIRRILLPQIMRMSIPSISNIYIDIIKGSSLAFTIGVAEMMAKAQMVAAKNYRFFECYIIVAIIYWILIEIFNFLQKLLEKKLSVY